MPDTHKYVILFGDGREIATPPAEDLEIEPRAEGGLRKGRLKLLGGQRATIFLDLDRVLAVYPVATGPEEQQGAAALERYEPFAGEGGFSTFGGTSSTKRWPYEDDFGLDEPDARAEAERRERRKEERHATQSRELDREIVAALVRSEEMKDSNLADPYPILRSFERRGTVPAEVREFTGSREAVRERLEAMREEGLVRHAGDGWYAATGEGAELAGLGLPPTRKGSPSPELHEHYRKMVDLCQAIMASVSEEARWVTDRELLDGAVRSRLEEEIGRSLPATRPSHVPRVWPSTPEGVLVLEETGTTSAVGLELTRVTDTKLGHYAHTVLKNLAQDPALDRAYLVFREEQALRRVENLAGLHRQDGFFVFRQYRVDDPLGFREE